MADQKMKNIKNKYIGTEETQRDSDRWVKLGYVSHLIIYPIDRGTGYLMNNAICTKNGIEAMTTDPILQEIKDRRLVVYDKVKDEVILDPFINKTNYDRSVCYYGKAEDLEINPILNNIKITNKNYVINQEEEDKKEKEKKKKKKREDIPIPLRCLRSHHYEPLKDLLAKRNKDLNVGYFAASDRQILNDKHRYSKTIKNPQSLNQHYSHYTLINARSLKHLKIEYQKFLDSNRITGEKGKNITYLNFFPHIVIDGEINIVFKEDTAVSVKIGNVEFGQILPCIHDKTINFNHTGRSPLENFYRFLSSYRPLRSVGRQFSAESELPVFGINMEKATEDCLHNDKICVGDAVYVKLSKKAAK